MIFPAPTSLIPVQIALTRFLETNGLGAVFTNYPFWYLGTTPFRFLTGPVLPLVLLMLHRFLPNFSLFELMFFVMGFSWVFGSIGLYKFIEALGAERKTAFLCSFFYFFGPFVPFLFRFSNGLYFCAFAFLPWIFLLYLKFLQRETKRTRGSLIALISFVLLIDTLILPSLILGMVCLFLAKTGWHGLEEKIKKTFFLLILSILIVTLWYTLAYWLAILGTPSWAGKGLSGLISWLLQILPTTLAFILAIFSVKVFKEKNLTRDFLFYWLFVFGFLTLIRFLSDIDFWMDWTAYALELQLGLGLGLGLLLRRFSKITFSVAFLAIYFFIFIFIFNTFVLKTMQKEIKQTVEYQIGEELARVVRPDEKVFLSGTTVFWLNVFFDVNQVRGGQDQVAVDQNWRKAVWEIRQGENPSKALQWLQKLKISYLVVHTDESREFYHDFVHPEIFDETSSLEKIYDVAGDRIYRVLE